jgi:hypothetical protein
VYWTYLHRAVTGTATLACHMPPLHAGRGSINDGEKRCAPPEAQSLKKSVRPRIRVARGRQGRHGEEITAALTATSCKEQRRTLSVTLGVEDATARGSGGRDFGDAWRMSKRAVLTALSLGLFPKFWRTDSFVAQNE